ncbi:MAG: hypothetical protein IKO26_00780 [Paludibacteraceae bacterium]|nr:hypothetical protein [Paludibacteraceae bacterium]
MMNDGLSRSLCELNDGMMKMNDGMMKMNDGLRRKKEGKGGPPQSHEWGRRARGTTRESRTGGEGNSRSESTSTGPEGTRRNSGKE